MPTKTADTGYGPPALDLDAPLVGREAESGRLAAFAAGAARDGGTLMLLGEPGVGKSALLAGTVREARAAGTRVLQAAGLPALAAVFGIERGTAAGGEELADAVVRRVAQSARDAPVLLVLDDAQRFGRAEELVLGQVARRLAGTGAGMVCAARPGAERFCDYGGLALQELGPLGQGASEELLGRRFPDMARRVRRRLMADAEGNPLALLELAAALTEPQRAGMRALPARIPLTERLQAAFASRIPALPSATRHLLLVAALEGGGELRVIRRAAAGRCGLKHLAPAERAGLVAVDDSTGRLGFRHPLLRAAVVHLSTSDQRRAAHRALAHAWSTVPERRAWHLAQAAVAPDGPIADRLEQAADLGAGRGDGPGAVAALLRAADLSPSGPEQARRLAKAAYLGANLTGELREVPRLLDDARRAAPDGDSLAVTVAAALYLLHGHGEIDSAHRLLSRVIAAQPVPYDPGDTTLVAALAVLMPACFYSGRPIRLGPPRRRDRRAARHPGSAADRADR
ncbi:ATP-binding protein [Actinospica durhamensis]|uniref:ATP-binding protein n=1 Tax=Actinospica durhamensis TaxID=1508375 RepID=A0A941EX68_9ACTN|nr:ATP-binding protein [Actinospica durhamensis]MBR7838626.1 ATP-binding protein [Actinospica durhamensis]